MIKIISGWSDKGGSTTAFINLTNALNSAGYDTTFYGPHDWHLTKCKSGKLTNEVLLNCENDTLIFHFLQLDGRPKAKRVILSCHEKNLFLVGKIKQYWDEVIFINEKHRNYHKDYNGKYSIIPNFKQNLKVSDKTGLEMVAGVIGTFDENKQTHVSIIRALSDGCDKVYLFGTPTHPYYNNFVKPLLSEKVIEMGFIEDKQSVYNMIGRVYHSSISEVAPLVKDECELTGTLFFGNEATDVPVSKLSNEQILSEWIKVLQL